MFWLILYDDRFRSFQPYKFGLFLWTTQQRMEYYYRLRHFGHFLLVVCFVPSRRKQMEPKKCASSDSVIAYLPNDVNSIIHRDYNVACRLPLSLIKS